MYLPIKNKSFILSHLVLLTLVLNGCSFMDARKKDMMVNRVIAKDLPITDDEMNDKIKNGITNSLLAPDVSHNQKLMVARNEQIDAILRMSDDNYNDFKNFIYTDNSTFESAIGIASLGMTAAATLLTGPVVPILTATDTAMKGAHSVINEKWIQNKTISSIVAAIDTVRNQIQTRIENGKAKPYEEYTMQAALVDLHDHNNAASMLNGLIYLENMAKNQQASTQVQLDATKATPKTAQKLLEEAKATLTKAKAALIKAQAESNKAKTIPTAIQEQFDMAETALTKALTQIDSVKTILLTSLTQLNASIDALSAAQIQLNTAKTALTKAQAQLSAANTITTVAQAQFDEAETALTTAQAQFDALKTALSTIPTQAAPNNQAFPGGITP